MPTGGAFRGSRRYGGAHVGFVIHCGLSCGRHGSVPNTDSGNFAVVTQDGQSPGIKQEMLSGARWKPDPARRENPQYVSVRKQSDIALKIGTKSCSWQSAA